MEEAQHTIIHPIVGPIRKAEKGECPAGELFVEEKPLPFVEAAYETKAGAFLTEAKSFDQHWMNRINISKIVGEGDQVSRWAVAQDVEVTSELVVVLC